MNLLDLSNGQEITVDMFVWVGFMFYGKNFSYCNLEMYKLTYWSYDHLTSNFLFAFAFSVYQIHNLLSDHFQYF